MKINHIENYNPNKKVPQFKGSVSPEFVRYVDGIRNDCLQTVPKRSANFINNVCDSILQKSNEIMKNAFPPTSVLSVGTKEDTECVVVGIEDGILKKYGAGLTGSNFIKEYFSPTEKLKMLKLIITDKTRNVFVDANAKHLMGIQGIGDIISGCNDYSRFNEGFSDLEYLLNWWNEHVGFLPLDFERFSALKNYINSVMSDLKEHREELMQNRTKVMRNEIKSVSESLSEHIQQTLGMSNHDVLYSGRKSEQEMNKLADELVPPVIKDMQSGKIGKQNIKSASNDLYKYRIYKIDGTKNCYRGPLGYSDIAVLKPLKLKEIDIEFATDDCFTDHIDEIVDFIKSMQSDSVYFGCMHGTNRTTRAVTLDYYLNPLQKHGKAGGFSLNDFDYLLDLCDALTFEQKKELQWTEKFEKELRTKLKKDYEDYINNK